MDLGKLIYALGHRRHHRPRKNKKKRDYCDVCDLGCDGCDICDCNLSILRLSSLLLAAATLAPSGRTSADRAGLSAIRAYQRWLSPRLGIRCPYTPSCSRYGAAAVERHGLRAGLRLTATRLRRCRHTVPPGTPDPVP